jgi:hypothetical protein
MGTGKDKSLQQLHAWWSSLTAEAKGSSRSLEGPQLADTQRWYLPRPPGRTFQFRVSEIVFGILLASMLESKSSQDMVSVDVVHQQRWPRTRNGFKVNK